MKSHCQILILGFLLFVTADIPALGQPSGGPYGPMHQTYTLPHVAGKIYYVAVDGKAEQSGESLNTPTSLEAAMERVRTGDAIVLRGGTYRTGNLLLNQGITIQPYADEQPVLKGTFIAADWKNLGNELWKTSWSHLFPSQPDSWWSRDRYGKETPLHIFNNDMVFIDGKFLQSAGREGDVNENSYYIDYDTKQVYIGVDPTNRLVEITAFNAALVRTMKECHGKTPDHRGPAIRGITFTQYAYRAIEVEGKEPEALSAESDHGKDVIGTTLEDCTISFCSRVAAYLRGDKLTLRRCKVTETSTEGIYIIGSSDVLLEKNIFSRNNIEKITGYYPAAVKIFNQSYRVTCQENLVIDLPYSNGIWYDVGNVDGRFLNNWVEGVGSVNRTLDRKKPWPSENGFFFEISKNAVCAGNVFVNCDQGIFILNSSNVLVYQNTFVNSTVCFARNERTPANDGTFGWHSSTGPDVDKRDGHIFVNNLLVGGPNYLRSLLFVWQPPALCNQLSHALLKHMDYNVYIRNAEKASSPLMWWSPAPNAECQAGIDSLENLRKLYPEFSANSRIFINYDGPLFKSRELGNYQIVHTFPGSTLGMPLPANISTLLGQSIKNGRYVGAYPPLP
ncbi:MAG: right-handed parallel beta-helix repeat-containing protein [Ignavibacteriae bacterium]|nr:MAG: right-handed parallel beta-helix repeat-containing protein [Ignavibacteriota bacterium]